MQQQERKKRQETKQDERKETEKRQGEKEEEDEKQERCEVPSLPLHNLHLVRHEYPHFWHLQHEGSSGGLLSEAEQHNPRGHLIKEEESAWERT